MKKCQTFSRTNLLDLVCISSHNSNAQKKYMCTTVSVGSVCVNAYTCVVSGALSFVFKTVAVGKKPQCD